MNLNQIQHRLASLSSLSPTPQMWHHRHHSHLNGGALSRRQFIRTTAGAAGLVLGSSLIVPAVAGVCNDPKPIPGGLQLLLPDDPTVFHLLLPGSPLVPDNNNPATNDPSVITDFDGDIGLAYVRGTGTHTDKTTGEVSQLPFEVDLRFMTGTFVGMDNRTHQGAFSLI